MGKGRNRRKNPFISKRELQKRFPFLDEWTEGDFNNLYYFLKRLHRSPENSRKIRQQTITEMKKKNPLLSRMDDAKVKAYIYSYRLSLMDRFQQESESITNKVVYKKLKELLLFPKHLILEMLQ